ncbi:hypothetical protein OsI_25684 [Oryza sativa Indica Group]|uniref:Uncharacterized protein n=1 Tax=Oryza sativa subsp. indica TaxID=39946 RepID=A2YKD8_ORYSI|nr:hypothetical protein OsI_25684 [Oryza sativa Indica Group]
MEEAHPGGCLMCAGWRRHVLAGLDSGSAAAVLGEPEGFGRRIWSSRSSVAWGVSWREGSIYRRERSKGRTRRTLAATFGRSTAAAGITMVGIRLCRRALGGGTRCQQGSGRAGAEAAGGRLGWASARSVASYQASRADVEDGDIGGEVSGGRGRESGRAASALQAWSGSSCRCVAARAERGIDPRHWIGGVGAAASGWPRRAARSAPGRGRASGREAPAFPLLGWLRAVYF